MKHCGAEIFDTNRLRTRIDDLHMSSNDGQAIKCFVVGLDVEVKVGIFVAQGESFPAAALLFLLSNKLQTLAGRPSCLFHPGVG